MKAGGGETVAQDQDPSRKEDRKAKCDRCVSRSGFEDMQDLDPAFEKPSPCRVESVGPHQLVRQC